MLLKNRNKMSCYKPKTYRNSPIACHDFSDFSDRVEDMQHPQKCRLPFHMQKFNCMWNGSWYNNHNCRFTEKGNSSVL